MKLKERRKKWLKRVLATTPEERAARQHKNMLRRMANVNPRTHTSVGRIGRNDPCFCGNVCDGVFIDDGRGGKVEKPVKLKNCCIHKLQGRVGMTPELAAFQKKEQAYFDKYRRLPQ